MEYGFLRNKRLAFVFVFIFSFFLISSCAFALDMRIAAYDSTASEKAAATYICDGVDDQTEIQNAVNSVSSSGGGIVYLASGNFRCASEISMRSNVELRGAGKESTIIDFYGSGSVALKLGTYITLSDFQIRGKGRVFISTSHNTIKNIKVYDVDNSYIAAFYIYGESEVIEDIKFINCEAIDVDRSGFDTYCGGSGCTIKNIYYEGCRAVNCGRYAQYVGPLASESWDMGFIILDAGILDNVTMKNCHAEGCWEAGFHSEPESLGLAFPSNVSLINCSSNNNGWKYKTGAPSPDFYSGFTVVKGMRLENCTSQDNVRGFFCNDKGAELIGCKDTGSDEGFVFLLITEGLNITSCSAEDTGIPVYAWTGNSKNVKIRNMTIYSSILRSGAGIQINSVVANPSEIYVYDSTITGYQYGVKNDAYSKGLVNVQNVCVYGATTNYYQCNVISGCTPGSTTTTVISTTTTTILSDLAIHLKFDEGSGLTAYDSSLHGNDGILINGTTWITGKSGTAAYFDGTNDYIDCGNSASLDIRGPITIAAWVKPYSAQELCSPNPERNAGVASKVDGAAGSTTWSWQLRFGAPNNCYLGFQFNNAGTSKWVTAGQTLAPGTWYHVAATYDGSTITMYVNGYPTETNAMSSLTGYPNKLILGAEGWDMHFQGAIDDFRIYRRSLSASEISDIANIHSTTTTTKTTTTTVKTTTTTISGNVIYPVGSCLGRCGKIAVTGTCYCDATCVKWGDCCPDACSVCGYNCLGEDTIPTTTIKVKFFTPLSPCFGYCGQKSPGGCYCDKSCMQFEDCCWDICSTCGYCAGTTTTTTLTTTTASSTTTTIISTTTTKTTTTVISTTTTTKTTTTTVPIQINSKDMSRFSSREAFLVSDDDWSSVMTLVSTAIWTETNGNIIKHPVLIYHKEPSGFDADSIIHFLQQYKPTHLTVFGSTPSSLDNLLVASSPVGAGLNSSQITKVSTDSYLTYWSSIESVVVVGTGNYKEALSASVWASYTNSPLLILNSTNIDATKQYIDAKYAYVVGDIDSTVSSYINSSSKVVTYLTLDDMEQLYFTSTETNKVILVNSNDLDIYSLENFSTEKSANISRLFEKQSLAAPILAASKHENIFSIELGASPENPECTSSPNYTLENNADYVDNFIENKDIPLSSPDICKPGQFCSDGYTTRTYALNTSDKIHYNFTFIILKDDIWEYAIYTLSLRSILYGCMESAPVTVYANGNKVGVWVLDCTNSSKLDNDIFYDQETDELTETINLTWAYANRTIEKELNISIEVEDDAYFIVAGNSTMKYTGKNTSNSVSISNTDSSSPSFESYVERNFYDTGFYGTNNASFYFTNMKNYPYNLETYIKGLHIEKYLLYSDSQYLGTTSDFSNLTFENPETSVNIKIVPVGEYEYTGWYKIPNVTLRLNHYLTIVSSPKAIPDSKYFSCIGGWQRREAQDWKYGDMDDSQDSGFSMFTGRIYGLTVSDTSSYIARSVFYEHVFQNIYPSGNYGGLSIAHTGFGEENASQIKINTSSSGYNSVCFTDGDYPGICVNDTSPDLSYYSRRNFITFSDHGGPGEWIFTLKSDSIPWLDLTYSYAMACLTNNYWEGGSSTFGTWMLRKGAIGYHGSSGVTYGHYGPICSIKKLTTENIPLGNLFSCTVMDSYIFLGDPTLLPKFKRVAWS